VEILAMLPLIKDHSKMTIFVTQEVLDFKKIYPVSQTCSLLGAKNSNRVNCSSDMGNLNCNFSPPGQRNMTNA